MNKIKKLTIAALGLGIVLALSPVLRAQEADAPTTPEVPRAHDQGGMMGTDMQGMQDMMRMMRRMSQMMEQCSRMMQNTVRQGTRAPDQH
jgi:hypothetical protein